MNYFYYSFITQDSNYETNNMMFFQLITIYVIRTVIKAVWKKIIFANHIPTPLRLAPSLT